MPPTVFMQARTVETTQWREQDSLYAMALEDYEAGLCPGGSHPLAETSRAEHQDAYRPGVRVRCHYCTAQAMVAETMEKEDHPAGLMVPLVLDPDIVARNLMPVPPLPPELAT